APYRFAALADLEAGGQAAAGRLAVLDADDLCGGRAVVEQGTEPLHCVGGAGGEHLDRPVRQAADGAAQAELAGPAPGPPAESHSLDAAVDAERAPGLGRFWHVGSGMADAAAPPARDGMRGTAGGPGGDVAGPPGRGLEPRLRFTGPGRVAGDRGGRLRRLADHPNPEMVRPKPAMVRAANAAARKPSAAG